MWLILSRYRWQAVLVCVLLCATWLSAYSNGYKNAERIHTEQGLQREQQHRAAEQQWQRYSQIQNAELFKAQQTIEQQARQLQQGNRYAIEQDQTVGDYNGIGTHSLRQYNRALGYPD